MNSGKEKMKIFIFILVVGLVQQAWTPTNSQVIVQNEIVGTPIFGEAEHDSGGWSVSLASEGARVAIGSPYNDGNGGNSGHVRVYQRGDSSWNQLGGDINGEAAGDRSGWSVSLSADGTRVAIGAMANAGGGLNAGHVRVYQWNGASWTQLGDDIDGNNSDYNGRSVSLSSDGNCLAVGASACEDNDGGINQGCVRIYEYSSDVFNGTAGQWIQLGGNIAGNIYGEADYDRSGYSVSLYAVGIGDFVSWDEDGDGHEDPEAMTKYKNDYARVAIGAKGNSENGSASGHVRVYEYISYAMGSGEFVDGNPVGMWQQIGDDIDGEASEDLSGTSVSINANGTRVAIGAPENDGSGNNSGHVRVFEYSNNFWPTNYLGTAGGVWSQVGGDIDGENADDRSGVSVSLNSFGDVLAIGADRNDSQSNTWAGHVRIYGYNGSEWSQQGNEINGETASETSGYSVSLSGDGSRVAVGGPYRRSIHPIHGYQIYNMGYTRIFEALDNLELIVSTNGNGVVSVTPGVYPIGTNLSFTATPAASWLFTGWSNAIVGDYSTATTNLTISGTNSMTVIANFITGGAISNALEEKSALENQISTFADHIDTLENETNELAATIAGYSNHITMAEAEAALVDARTGSSLIEISDSTAKVSVVLEQSEDLMSTWTSNRTVEVEIPIDADTAFFRFGPE